jgi:hypothetical protein
VRCSHSQRDTCPKWDLNVWAFNWILRKQHAASTSPLSRLNTPQEQFNHWPNEFRCSMRRFVHFWLKLRKDQAAQICLLRSIGEVILKSGTVADHWNHNESSRKKNPKLSLISQPEPKRSALQWTANYSLSFAFLSIAYKETLNYMGQFIAFTAANTREDLHYLTQQWVPQSPFHPTREVQIRSDL